MAEPVVDGLEAVEVDEEHGEHPVPPVQTAQRLTEPVHEQRSVGQRRQRIVQRQLRQGLGGLPLGRDVLGGARHAHRPSVDAADPAAALQPADRAVGQQAAVGEVERFERLQAALDRPLHHRPVVGVDAGDIALERAGEGVRGEPEDPVQLVGPADRVGGNVPVPDPDLGHRLGLAQLVAGRLQRGLQLLVLGHVPSERQHPPAALEGHGIRLDLHGEQDATPGAVVPPGRSNPRTGRMTGQQLLQEGRMVVKGQEVEHGHGQQLVPGPAVLADGRLVHGQDPQRVDVVDPHGQRVGVEQQRGPGPHRVAGRAQTDCVGPVGHRVVGRDLEDDPSKGNGDANRGSRNADPLRNDRSRYVPG